MSVDVSPYLADPDKPLPATFDAATRSGSIKVNFPTSSKDIPDRDYHTRVESSSSSIFGSFIFSSEASFYSKSGSIRAEVLAADWSKARLYTESPSGSTRLTLLSPYKEPGVALSQLHSSHLSTSGSINLVYPREWEGMIEGKVRSGSVKIGGKDVKWLADADTPVGRKVVARKGYGSSRLDFETNSGSVNMQIGDS